METKKDIFDRIKLDIFDRIELPVEEKVIYSQDMEGLVREAIYKEISKLPVGKIVSRVLKKEVLAQRGESKDQIDSKMEKAKTDLSAELEKIKAEIEKFEEKMRKKHDDFRNLFGSEAQPWYQFGGYPPPGGGLPLNGDTGLSEWRFIVVGVNLSVQKYESGVWVEKASFNP